MPLVIRDCSKKFYDDEARQEEHRAFLLKSTPFTPEKPEFDPVKWKKNISGGILRNTQKDKNVEDRKAITNAQKQLEYRARQKGLASAEEWKQQKNEKALENKILREKRKVDAKREKRAGDRAPETDQTPTIHREDQ